MLSGWHLPVSPFVRLADDALHITLWLQGDSLPAQVFLRCEPDNEEWLLTMEGHESHDRWRYSVSLPLYEGQPTRRYCFKLLCVTNGAIVIHTQRLKSDPGGNLLS